MFLKNLLKFLRLIESIGVEYMITGSVASILYGKPRLTQDMDVVVELPLSKVSRFAGLFDISEYYCPPEEALEEAVKLGNIGHMNVIDQSSGFKIDIYPIGDDSLGRWGFKDRRRVELLEGEEVFIAPPEYVILKKMIYYKEGGSQKHVDDIRGMLEVSGNDISAEKIGKWSRRLDLMDIWEEIKSKELSR